MLLIQNELECLIEFKRRILARKIVIWMSLKVQVLALTLLPMLARAADSTSAGGTTFFDEKVRPILESRCFECHSHKSGKMKNGLTLDSREGWASGGDSGPAIVPGDPEKSLLIKAVRRLDPDLEMPPKTKLPKTEVAVLEEWVRRGAPDPRSKPADNFESRKDWWSLKPLARPSVPSQNPNAIDAFIEAKLQEKAIKPAPEADRRTLIRRLYFDLIGLLPKQEEVTQFEKDNDAKAYEKLVDRLLDSPRYGERWARHWLDTIHFADTHGFEHDLIRTNAWRYRDYVIESLNRDTPWPRFIREQLAADVLYPDEPHLRVALGFLGAGPFDVSTAQTAPKTFDYLDRDDMVTQTMAAFASTTVNCARCHDHKFDAITQEDYYSLQAVFAGVGKGDVEFDEEPGRWNERLRWKQLLAAVREKDSAVLLNPINDVLVENWASAHGGGVSWEVLRPESFEVATNTTWKLLEDGSLLLDGARPDTDTYTFTASAKAKQITAVQLEILSDPSLPKNGPGRQPDNGNMHLSEFVIRTVVSTNILKIRRATSDFDQSGWTINHAIDGDEKTAWGIDPKEGESHLAIFELQNRVALTNGAHLVFQLKQLHGRNHLIGKLRLSVTGDDPGRATVLPATVAEAVRTPPENRSTAQRLELAQHALKAIAEERLSAMPGPSVVFAAAPVFKLVADGNFYQPWKEPKAIYVYKRGDIEKPGALAKPGALTAVAELQGRFGLDNHNEEGVRRAALANWLADPKNPLTWRSIVNRVWHYHFGRGIVDSPNDLGHMGSLPSHPELLDWLACEFRDNGGSLKKLHHLIVTSATYKRSTRFNESAFALDPDNRLLWRRQSRRLDAEAFRDEVLALSDRLDMTMGGPGVQLFKLSKPIQSTPTVSYQNFDWASPGANRRSIYRFVYRGLQDPFMDAMDFPDTAQLAPTRPFSASALQALALLNDDFVLFQCERIAERLERQSASENKRIREAFRLVFQREPTQVETADFRDYAKRHGLAAMCRVLLNSNEFLFVD